MKFLKLVNFPLALFRDSKYGKTPKAVNIPWDNIGSSVLAMRLKHIQVNVADSDDFITYVPIIDEDKLNNIMPLINRDINELNIIQPELDSSAEIVEDDYETWKEEALGEKKKILNKDQE